MRAGAILWGLSKYIIYGHLSSSKIYIYIYIYMDIYGESVGRVLFLYVFLPTVELE